MNYAKRADLKNSARDLLRGKYSYVILTYLLVSMLSMGIKFSSLFLLVPDNFIGDIIYYVATVLFSAVGDMFSVGIALFFLNICCQQRFTTMDLFYGFFHNPRKTFLVSLLFSILNLLCSIPSFFVHISATPENLNVLLKENLTYTAATLGCSILYSLVTLAFTQVYYLMLDFPDLSVKELFRYSFRLMRGNIGRYLLLEISFIPLLLLGLGSFGIGFLWITPYMQVTYALFYLDIMNNKKATP